MKKDILRRLKRLERRIQLPTNTFVVYEDPEKEGCYYNARESDPNRRRLSDKELRDINNDPDVLLIVVTRLRENLYKHFIG